MSKHLIKIIIDFSALSFLVLINQILKAFFVFKLNSDQTINLIGEFVSLELILNKGAIFGFMINGIALIVGTLVILIGLLFIYFKQIKTQNFLTRFGMIILFAGALSNLIDRVFFGYVIDWFKISFWPAFNLADVLIIVGVVWVLFSFNKRNHLRVR